MIVPTKNIRSPIVVALWVSLAAAKTFSELDETEASLLCSLAGPMVIAKACSDSGLAESVTDCLNTTGLMLPTTPLHWLLLSAVDRPLVSTSANIDGDCAPLIRATEILRERLGTRVRAMRDAIRGGVAAVLHEWAEASNHTLSIHEHDIPEVQCAIPPARFEPDIYSGSLSV